MNDILKLGFRLFIFALVAAAGLAVTNEVTKGPIAEQKLAAKRAALETVLPNSEYEQIEYENLEDGSELDEIFAAKDANGNVKGYALTASPQGYGGEIPITMGISTGGYVTQVYVGSLQETAGLGSRVGDAPFKEQFIGIAADPETLRNDVDKISGASVSSGAFLNASEQILKYTKNSLGIEPHAGDRDAILAESAAANGGAEEAEGGETAVTDVAEGGAATYEVTGFQPFKVAIETDADGKIISVTVPEHNETPGLGADLIADAAVFEALTGKDIATAQIDVKTGVTLTSNAINDALAQAAAKAAAGPKTYEVTGFQPFKVAIETGADGKIISVMVPEHNETPGLGADLIADTAVFEALVGKDIATAQIDVKTGVTLTSNAINDALARAAKDVAGDGESETVAMMPAGDAYTVKGFNKFTAYIDIENGVIASIEIPEHQETPALGGALIEEVLPTLVGKDLTNTDIDAKAGVTLTSNALKQVLDLAATANGILREVQAKQEETAVAESSTEAASAEAGFAGNAKIYEVTGFQPFKVAIETDADGKIVSVTVPENNETPGLGADLIADTAVFGALTGQDIRAAQIDVKAGVTLTSNAINDALAQAAKDAPAAEVPAEETAAEEAKTEEAAAEEVPVEEASAGNAKTYEVTGFQPFKVSIETDADGKIVSVTVPENNETPGLGADLIADTAVFGALAGQDIRAAQIDVKAGVTLTSNAINDALAQAAKDAPAAEVPAEETAAEEAKAEEAAAEEVPAEEAPAGNAKTYEVTGFQPFKVAIETDADGKIVSVTVPENNETPGLGADLIADTAVFGALVGQDVRAAQIDVKAGVTLTSNAINDALAQAAKDAPAVEEAAAGAKTYEVTGFQPFKVTVETDAGGKIVSVTVPENNETPGLGADLIADTAVFEALVGQDVRTAQIDVKTGVTLTSNAINDALAQAAKEAE